MSKSNFSFEVYAEIISNIAARACAKVEGAQFLDKNPDKHKLVKDNDVHAYLVAENNVKIDVYINVVYGYNIPDVVCKIQSAIKETIEKDTCYKVSEVNVSVVSVVFEEEKQPGIIHNHDEDLTNSK